MPSFHQSTAILAAVLVLSLLAGPAGAERPADEGSASLDTVADTSELVSAHADDLVQPPRRFVDFDEEAVSSSPEGFFTADSWCDEWGIYGLPTGFIYRPYLASPKETRLSTLLTDVPGESSTMWDATLGARIGLLRIGTADPIRPRGFQLDIEGSAQVRLDLPEDEDVRATDYRFGLPFTWGDERQQWRLLYYHISSHLGDEFLLKNPKYTRIPQARDVLGLGHSVYLTDNLRVYAEAAWAFNCVSSDPWEFQFGVDYAPRGPTGCWGAPFVAVNAHLRQELNFGGGLTIQSGWAWRSGMNPGMLRIGLHYYNGASTQYSFLPFHEQQIGGGVWYDF